MRNTGLHRSSMSRYTSRSFKRSSMGRRGSYSVNKNTFKSYLQEAKKLSDDIGETEKTEDTAKTTKASAYSKTTYSSRKKAAEYSVTGSKYNNGVSGMETGYSAVAKLLKDDEPDMEKAYEAAGKFVSGYNDMYASVRSSSNKSVVTKAGYINSVTNMFSRRLENAGISVGSDGKLSIDKDKFMEASKKDLEDIFGTKSSYASVVTEQTDAITKLSDVSASTYSSGFGSSYTSAYSGSFWDKMF